MTSFFCAECNYETEEQLCPLCEMATETLELSEEELMATSGRY